MLLANLCPARILAGIAEVEDGSNQKAITDRRAAETQMCRPGRYPVGGMKEAVNGLA